MFVCSLSIVDCGLLFVRRVVFVVLRLMCSCVVGCALFVVRCVFVVGGCCMLFVASCSSFVAP